MKEIGMWMRENPGYTFLLIIFALGVMGDCGVEFAKAVGHR